MYRFSKLAQPVVERKQQLEDSLQLHKYCRDVEDELQWIKERRPLADSNDYGKSLRGVQNLQKKHQVRSSCALIMDNRWLLQLHSLGTLQGVGSGYPARSWVWQFMYMYIVLND